MLKIYDTGTDARWNLAAEEYLLHRFSEPVFRLWRNADSIIIGRHQNAYAEIDLEYVREHGIKVVRRMTGGGAVFHDLGNVNYSFFNLRGQDFTEPVISALAALGLSAGKSGRNDILLDGRKISGTAAFRQGDRLLQHGTLLFSASMASLSKALRPRPEKFADKAVKSTVSRVTNISEHLSYPMSVEEFFDAIFRAVDPEGEEYSYNAEDLKGIDALYREKYATEEWNFGKAPAYSLSKVKKFPAGLVELYLKVEEGRIADLQIAGDYFFTLPTEEFCRAMVGCTHEEKEIAGRLSGLAVGEYFSGITAEELALLFFS